MQLSEAFGKLYGSSKQLPSNDTVEPSKPRGGAHENCITYAPLSLSLSHMFHYPQSDCEQNGMVNSTQKPYCHILDGQNYMMACLCHTIMIVNI